MFLPGSKRPEVIREVSEVCRNPEGYFKRGTNIFFYMGIRFFLIKVAIVQSSKFEKIAHVIVFPKIEPTSYFTNKK